MRLSIVTHAARVVKWLELISFLDLGEKGVEGRILPFLKGMEAWKEAVEPRK